MKCDKYMGMDVHQAMTVVVVLDADGRVILETMVPPGFKENSGVGTFKKDLHIGASAGPHVGTEKSSSFPTGPIQGISI